MRDGVIAREYIFLEKPLLSMLWLSQMTASIGDQCYSFALLWYLLQAIKSGTALSLLVPRIMMVGTDLAQTLVVITVSIMAAMGIEQFSFFLAAQFLIGVFANLFQEHFSYYESLPIESQTLEYAYLG